MKTRLLVLALVAATSAQASVYDLNADWSDLANPNGAWRLDKNISTPFTISQGDYWSNGTNQKAWADEPFQQNAHVPFWMKATVTTGLDYLIGDVVMHGAVPWRTGSADTSAVLVSPEAGIAIISGSTWETRDIGRRMEWQLLKNGVVFSDGMLLPGQTSRANPFLFSDGSGGIGAMAQFVAIGDRLELRMHSLDDAPDIAGVNFRVEVVVPEPGAWVAAGFGLLFLAARRRR